MKYDVMLNSVPGTVRAEVQRASDEGADGAWVVETKHDPFLLIGAAAQVETGLRLGTGVAVAFARTPMLLASVGYDLQRYSGGRFVMGLGTQVRTHIRRRFSMPWDKPVARMRETVEAMHAIWDSWEKRVPLRHRGLHYTHDLMTPAFSPEPHEFGRPPVYLGGLGPAMTTLAGEVADGFVVHRFMTRKFLEEVTLPRLDAGRRRRGNPDASFEIAFPPFFAAADDAATLDKHLASVRKQIAFYASTPAYAPVLELHGWSSVGRELHGMSLRGEWDAMGRLITDPMLEAFAVVSRENELRAALEKRYGDLVDRVILFPLS